MSEDNIDLSSQLLVAPTDDSGRRVLAELLHARVYAQDAEADEWDFALEIDGLYDAGVTINDLRWMISKGYAQHGRETSVSGDAHRSFDPSEGFNFTTTTCFVLTAKGAQFADKVLKKFTAD